MSDRLAAMGHDELEARLTDLARVLEFPSTPDLAGAVASRLRAATGAAGGPEAPAGPPERTPVRVPRRRPWPVQRSLRRSLLLAAALALLVVGAAFAVRFGLELLSIEFGTIPSAAPSALAPGSTGEGLGLGEPSTVEESGTTAAFDVLVPAALGEPDAVYVGGPALRGQVAFVYGPRDGLPASDLLGGAGLLVTQNRGEPDEGLTHKLVETGQATVTPVNVHEAFGLWISGNPHFYWYVAPDGAVIQESRRLVGDTLAWERDGVLYRIEGAITLDQALEIAGSMR